MEHIYDIIKIIWIPFVAGLGLLFLALFLTKGRNINQEKK